MAIGSIAWDEMFVPRMSLVELFIRGTVMYGALFVLLRMLAKRNLAALGIQDMLLVVLIADAAQNGMSSDYRSVPEGIVLCATIVFWSYALDWLSLHSSRVRGWLETPPLAVVRRGRLQRQNMRREMITEDELMSQLRVHGIDDLKEVKVAFIEPDGQISVIRNQLTSQDDTTAKKKVTGA